MPVHEIVHDAVIPQLEKIWNPDDILAALTTQLANCLSPYEKIDCRILRFRYRPHKRSIILYELNMVNKRSGEKRVDWLTGCVYADASRTRHLYRKLKSRVEDQQHHYSDSPLPLVFYIKELALLMQLYPFDRYLEPLCGLFSELPEEVHSILSESPKTPCLKGADYSIQPMRYRPFLGATVRIQLREQDSGACYMKLYRRGESLAVFDYLQDLVACNQHLCSSVQLVKPVACINRLDSVILAEVPGADYLALLMSDSLQKITHKSHLIGEALAHFHLQGKVPRRTRRGHETIRRAQRAADMLTWADRSVGRTAKTLIQRHRVCLLQDISLRASHLDMKPDHIIISGEQVTLIDLDSSAMSDPVADIAMMAVRLLALSEMRQIQHTTARTAIKSLMDSYRARVPAQWLTRLDAHLAMAWLKVTLFYFQHNEENWQARTKSILDQITQTDALVCANSDATPRPTPKPGSASTKDSYPIL